MWTIPLYPRQLSFSRGNYIFVCKQELKVRRVILVFHYGVVTIFTLIILLVTFLYMPPMPEAA